MRRRWLEASKVFIFLLIFSKEEAMNAIDKIRTWQDREQLDNFQAAKRIGISESLFFRVIHGSSEYR